MNNEYNYKLERINKKLELCIELFNTVLKDVKNIVSNELTGDFLTNMYNGVVDKIILVKPSEPILFFIKNVYSNDEYRKNIIDGNDEFFQNTKFDEIQNDENKMKVLFQFKSCWYKLTDDKKIYIKNAMKTLIDISKKYIEEKDNGNKLLKYYTEKN